MATRSQLRLACCLLVFGLCLIPAAGRADIVFLKDGFTLQGKVKRENTLMIDPVTKEQIPITKINGFYMVDDYVRRIIFNYRQVQDADSKSVNQGTDLLVLRRYPVDRAFAVRIDPLANVLSASPWSDKWERTFEYENEQGGKVRVQQRMTVLTPNHAQIDTMRHHWTQLYLTRELDPRTVKSLLLSHPDIKPKSGKMAVTDRLKVYRFLVQTGWFDEAQEELEDIVKEATEAQDKERVQDARDKLRQLRSQLLLDDLDAAHKMGRHQWVLEQAAGFLKQQPDGDLASRARTFLTHYESAREGLTQAQRLLKELPPRVSAGSHRKVFEEAARSILEELKLEQFLPEGGIAEKDRGRAQRLGPFLTLALQAEREQKQGKTPSHPPDELLSLAVSGWLLGSGSAEAKPDTAARLWRARQLVLEYQKTPEEDKRRQLLAAYQKSGESVAFDELAQLIGFLPPPEPEENLDDRPMELQTKLPQGRKKGDTYLVQLPPEYHHGRPSPVLIVLHNGGERPRDMLNRWLELARKHGYILVAPAWEGTRPTYQYTPEEHEKVTEVVRDLRRRFQVDSDRVFLAGHGEGGNMALDVGLSHPDLFAGVIPMTARPRYFTAGTAGYWRNGQNLPFYVVTGDMAGDGAKFNRRLFEQWMARNYASLYIEYKGRGMEWFGGELPSIFDWMSRKKRATAVPELGRNPGGGVSGEEYQSMRQTDNRFYWLSTEGIDNRHINDAVRWDHRITPATFHARILTESNRINVRTRGLKQVSVWLGRGMVDFEKPVTILVNDRLWNNNGQPLKPSLATLLEDFHQRGDRQRLFLAKVDFGRP